MKNTVVKNSQRHGRGLFALRNISAGECIEPIQGDIVLRESSSKYAMSLTGRRSLILTNKTKFVNFSRPSNSSFNLRKQALVATRDIVAGEEITAEYDSVF